ncbi:MAG: GNAT family protein [Pseudomonadota bacterium]
MLTRFERHKLELTGETVVLRPPRDTDYAAWSALRQENEAHLKPWEPIWPAHANSRTDWASRLRSWKKAWRDRTGFAFLIERAMSRDLVGSIALWNVRYGSARTGSVGYWLCSEAEGTGAMTQALNLVCAFGFSDLGLARIEAGTLPENDRSQGVLRRCGFQQEGYARQFLEIAGERRDHVLFARLANDPLSPMADI